MEYDAVEETGDSEKGFDLDMRDRTEDVDANDIVDLSRDEGNRNGESDSSPSINTNINNIQAGKSPNHGKKN
jgi:hypothetical protein